MFLGVYWNQLVCLSISLSVCVQNTVTSFCESACGVIKSHFVTALVSPASTFKLSKVLLFGKE